jgi:hypothetical protein
MMDQVLKSNNFYEKRDMEFDFAVTCLPTHNTFVSTTEGVSVRTVRNPANI